MIDKISELIKKAIGKLLKPIEKWIAFECAKYLKRICETYDCAKCQLFKEICSLKYYPKDWKV